MIKMELSRRSIVSWVLTITRNKITNQLQLPGTIIIAVHTRAQALEYTHFGARGISSGNILPLTSHMPSGVRDVPTPNRTRGVGVIYYDRFMGSLYADERVNLVITTAEPKPHNVFIVRTLACDLPATARRGASENRSRPKCRSARKSAAVQSRLPELLLRQRDGCETIKLISILHLVVKRLNTRNRH